MKLRTLLLGSATAMVMAGGAYAADLTVAEPVDYVRVCDAFGVGYWYIPGTDTCIKIGGDVEFDATVFNDNEDYYSYYGVSDAELGNHYGFGTGVYLTIDTKSMTDWGPLEGFIAFFGANGGSYNVDEAYISIGPLLVGYTRTLMTYMRGGFAWDGGSWFNAEHKVNTVRLTWAMNGFGLAVALEDHQGYWGSWYDYYYIGDGYSSFPDVVAALTFSNAMFDAKISGIYSDAWDTTYGNGFAIAAGITVKLDSLAPGDKFLIKGGWGAGPWAIGENGMRALQFQDYLALGEATWSVMGSFVHYLSPNFWASVTASYASGSEWIPYGCYCLTGDYLNAVQAQFALGYEPAPNFWLKPSITWIHGWDTDGGDTWSDWVFNLRVQRDFGGK
jgi:hypothetical protein